MKQFALQLFILFCLSCNEKQPAEQVAVTPSKPVAAPPVVIEETDSKISDTVKTSLKAIAEKKINTARVTIRYHSPAVRGRIIWGGLVPLDQVWVTGAHMATSFEVDKSFALNGKPVPAGKYALFTIPRKEEWTIILNKNWQQHLTDEYNPEENIIHFRVKPTSSKKQERLMFTIDQTGENQGEIEFRWDTVRVHLTLRIK